MKKLAYCLICLLMALTAGSAMAQMMMRPPAFLGGIPGRSQFDAMLLQRHQARTLLYREALEELRKNPQAADLPTCGAGVTGPCLAIEAPAAAAAPAQDKAVPAAPPAVPEKPLSARQGRRLALLVGNNDYPHPIPALETPVADVTAVARVLESRFGFTTTVVRNAGQARIIEALNTMAAEAKPQDHVLLFYAGHGYLLDDIKMGFWIPVDASVKTAKGWISNADISKMLAAIEARQLILISDSCFSGSLTREQKVTDLQTRSADELFQRRSVVVLSSGGDEPVSDEGKEGHSIFAWSLIKTLQGIGAVTPGVRVWKTVNTEVHQEYSQEPQYGAVVSAGHVPGGDYVFQPQ